MSTPQPISTKAFLETTPPYESRYIDDVKIEQVAGENNVVVEAGVPAVEIDLLCGSEVCQGGRRVFAVVGPQKVLLSVTRGVSLRHVAYDCRNCGDERKHYSLRGQLDSETGEVELMKLGELPPFGERVPRKVLELLGDDSGLFLKGKSAENRGLGIGAFAYYRQVVERQKDAVFHLILDAARLAEAGEHVISELEKAKASWRFQDSVDRVRDLIPGQLKIAGHHNPLVLLHRALSKNLHNGSDKECLEAARSIRVVLIKLVEKVQQLRTDDAEMKAALGDLLRDRSSEEEEPADPQE